MVSVIDGEESYCYNERNELTHRKNMRSVTEYIYDENGSLIREKEGEKETGYRYDLLNRKSHVRMSDGREQENLYDGEGLRAGLTENGKSTTFLFYNGENLAECDGDSMPMRRHVSGLGLSHVQTLPDDAYHMYYQDEQGSTAYVTSIIGETENLYSYDAFGNILEKREDITNRILYTCQQYDQETGQYYLRARYYNPVIGRFTQEDTYRGDGLNLYAYCGNNPVMYYDPSGHAGCDPDKKKELEETNTKKKSGETSATAMGKEVHAQKAEARKASGEFSSVNEKLTDANGNVIEVPKTVNKKTGIETGGTQGVIPNAVKEPDKGGIIIDDKPAGRPISKDYQEMRRNAEAYEIKFGEDAKEFHIKRYDPVTGADAGVERYSIPELRKGNLVLIED